MFDSSEERDKITVGELEELVLEIVEAEYEERSKRDRRGRHTYGVSFDPNPNVIQNMHSKISEFFKKFKDPYGKEHLNYDRGDKAFIVKVFEALQNLEQKGILVEVEDYTFYLSSLYKDGKQSRSLQHPKIHKKK